MHCAVSNGVEGACSILTEAGANPREKDHEGKTPIDLAYHFKNANVITIMEGAQERAELLALKDLGIGTHRSSARDSPRVSNAVAAPITVAAA